MKALYASLTPAQLAMQSRMAFAAMMSDPARVETATRWAEASDPRSASISIAELMTTDLREEVASIRTPVLVIPALKAFESMPGGAERASVAYGAQVRKIPSHQIVPATNALHFVMYDDLPFLLRAIDAFLPRQQDRSADMATQTRDLERFVVAAAAGDRDAFGHLVTATSGVVSSISLAILRDLDMSRDVSQDVFLAAWRDLRKLRSPASFLPWLRQLARNRAHHVLRSHARARRREVESVTDTFLAAINDPRPNAAAQLVAREEATTLARALDALPDDTREVLTLFYREGQSVAQVSALLDLTEDAVKKRLSRARATLREAVLESVGRTMSATVPGSAFTTVVLGALTAAAPTTASAAGIAASKGGASAGLGANFLLLAASALPGALGGAAGVLGGSRYLLREARDNEELRGVRRFRIVATLTVVVFALGFPAGHELTRHWRPWPVVNFVLFIAVLLVQYTVWLPRILRRRFEAEMSEDPVRAVARRRRERRTAIIGWTLGLLFGTLGLVLGMWL